MENRENDSFWKFLHQINSHVSKRRKENSYLPNLIQIVADSRSYRNKIRPLPRANAVMDGDVENQPASKAEKQEAKPEEDCEGHTRVYA